MSTASSFKTATSNIKFTGVEFVEQLTARAATLPVIYGNPGNVTLNVKDFYDSLLKLLANSPQKCPMDCGIYLC